MPMKKINSIKFKNFKAFYGEETIQLDGKNLLIYGENGSGKSSIFWGLYTFLQSSSKSIGNTTKYFVDFDNAIPSTYDSLKNIFSTTAEDAFIELETIETATGVRVVDRIDAINTTTDLAKKNQLISLANASSDFINYKLLHNFYIVTHKQDINLWQVFMRDIFPFFRNIETEQFYKERIDIFTEDVPRVSRTRVASKNSWDYRLYLRDLNALNLDIQNFLLQIEQNANDFIRNNFFDDTDVLRLNLTYSNQINYNAVRAQKKDFAITLYIEVWDKITTTWKPIKRPHSFLNEAQLTRIAIGVRFGALLTRLQNTDYQILCLDDMLISLDMGNRDKVIQLVLNTENKAALVFFDSFQKLIFTHDKSFYNLCKQRIILAKKSSDWYFKEIYLDSDSIPQRPYIDNSSNYFEKAEKYLKSFDYPASANALRQGLENLVFNFLPENERYHLMDGVTTSKLLGAQLSSLKLILERYNQDLTLINDLFVYKDQILNPLSHDNIRTQVYKEEIQKLISIIPILQTLETITLKKLDLIPTVIKLIDTDKVSGLQVVYHISIKEHLLSFCLLDGQIHLSRTECVVIKMIDTDGAETLLNNTYPSLKACANRLAQFLHTAYANDAEILSKLDLT